MPSPSKEERVLELFMNEPTKHWHFKDVRKTAKLSEAATNKWLRRFQKENIVRRIKPRGKMPYFQGNWDSPEYGNRKHIHALTKLNETGLLKKLQNINNAKTIVIFGSFARGDWNTESDVDVFILGDTGDLSFSDYWKGLGPQGSSREVQVHAFKSEKEIKEIHSGLMNNVVKGWFIKGNIHDIAEVKA